MQPCPDRILLKQVGVAYRIVFWAMLLALGVILLAFPGWSAPMAVQQTAIATADGG